MTSHSGCLVRARVVLVALRGLAYFAARARAVQRRWEGSAAVKLSPDRSCRERGGRRWTVLLAHQRKRAEALQCPRFRSCRLLRRIHGGEAAPERPRFRGRSPGVLPVERLAVKWSRASVAARAGTPKGFRPPSGKSCRWQFLGFASAAGRPPNPIGFCIAGSSASASWRCRNQCSPITRNVDTASRLQPVLIVLVASGAECTCAAV